MNKYGIVEKWKDIPGYEGYYQASNIGRIRSIPRVVKQRENSWIVLKSKILKPALHKNGYYFVMLSMKGVVKQFRVHMLVAMAWLNHCIDDGLVVNHINGDKQDNCCCNLELTTLCGNAQHAIRTGLVKTGFDSKKSRITHEQGLKIWQEKMETRCTNSVLAEKYNVSRTTILRVLRRIEYEHTLIDS